MRPPCMSEAKAPRKIARRQVAVTVDGEEDVALHRGGPGQSVEVVQDDDMGVSTPLEYNIFAMPADFTLETLHQKWRNGDIQIPKFQRGYVWKPSQASKLIESLMMGLPVPPVFLATGDDERSIVIDGMQRLMTIFSYLDGKYPDDSAYKGRKFQITGINEKSRLHGRTFLDLGDDDQRRLKNAVLRATIVMQNEPKDDDSGIYEIFERLNTGGTSLAPQEVRNCLYAGGLNDMLRNLNFDKDWRAILGKPCHDPRMKDIEMILRYLALFHAEGEYSVPMKNFLSRFMATHRNPDGVFTDTENDRFAGVCRTIRNTLGDKPFNNEHGQLRMPLFDSVFVSFARNPNRHPADIGERFKRLRDSDEFAKHAAKATTSVTAVRGRLRLAQEILFE